MEMDEVKSGIIEHDETDNDKSTENKDNVRALEFKKPLLVGKIGRFPKKLKSSLAVTNPSTEELSSELLKDTVTSSNEEVIKVENTPQKNDTFSNQYKEPLWSGLPKPSSQNYYFEILKDGSIIDTVNLMGKSYWLFGRLANCDIPMQHPTISRYHAVLQYRSEPSETDGAGFYIYDLDSTHGTFLNKNKLRPRVYVRIQVGHILKLGCSTRSYLLNGPEEDTEQESELSVTELKQKRQEDIERREREKIELIQRKQKEEEERKKKEEERGIDWGLGEDADEETDLSENPYAQSNNEDLYLDDPKKTLRGFFEREGLNLEYDCSEQGMGQFMCKVELPIDDDKGRPIYAEIIHKGKKKEAVVQCALEACRILDRYGLLRQAVHESRKRKAKDWAENDYYDSDDDTFLDRTGEIEKKREKRMNTKNPKKAETYEGLMEKERLISDSIRKVEKQLLEAQEKAKHSNRTKSEEDSLDAFMKDLKDSKPDKTAISKLRSELARLKQEHAKVIKLVNIAKPANLPPLVPQYSSEVTGQTGKSKVLPIFGKRKKVPVVVQRKTSIPEKMDCDEDEEEEIEQEKSNADQNINIDESDVPSEPEKINEILENNEKTRKISSYGLQTVNETKKPEVSLNQLDGGSVEDLCKNVLNGILDEVKLKSEQISLLNDPEVQKQHLDNLVSVIKTGVERIHENINKIQIEKSENIEDSHEDCDRIEPITHVESTSEEATKKKKNQRRIQQRQEKAEIEKRKGYAEDAKKEDYNMWIPPKDQSGDGRTKLNEKFGY
ncbi:kanadaptin [Coccinella septempunctata]|uniref:kanadaptin n=1 Tax=Coccinella septempunctata TaxID=41139 RepID=UPI001D077B6D|nr:kanadaptin [Coccinella septempunctata]